ncbi:hypothetical protein ASQ49_00140 [Acidipropionibacterium acidipropionici]|nr:hypothetical protein ASQ49_00140 [Acidipropionibacterium acidipropionici]
MNAKRIRSARSGSMAMSRISRPLASAVRTFRYPSGALVGVPPMVAFWVMPLMTSWARLRE